MSQIRDHVKMNVAIVAADAGRALNGNFYWELSNVKGVCLSSKTFVLWRRGRRGRSSAATDKKDYS
jgi:hypothetical protein